MFIIFPTGHEQVTARRWPVVTVLLVVANFLVFLALKPLEASRSAEAERLLGGAIEQLEAHPALMPPPCLQAHLTDSGREQLAEARSKGARATPAEQAILDELCERVDAAVRRVPSYHYGYRPADMNFWGLLSHQFLHGGWMHLLGNMWFLWLAGYVIEDAWGRLAFPAFYLLAGAFAALGHHLAEPHSAIPLIGASGAIAGVMGAFLVRNAKTKIKFFVWLIVRPFRFEAPAYLMLPLWFGDQVLWGILQPGGVAYFAHVGGFIFGGCVALMLRFSGAETELDQAIENRGALLEDPRIAESARLIEAGKPDVAVARLEALLAKEPRRIDVWLELLRASSVLGDPAREKRARLKLMELYLQQDLGDGALALYDELPAGDARASVPPSLRLRIARQYERSGRANAALHAFGALHDRPDPTAISVDHDWTVASAALIAHAELALKLGRREEAVSLWRRAQTEGNPEFVQIVKQGLARAEALPHDR
jgi:membrane associated rhomboid family serine protease